MYRLLTVCVFLFVSWSAFSQQSEKKDATTTAEEKPIILNIPKEYQNSHAKVKAWMKKEGLFGKKISFKATISVIGDEQLIVRIFECPGTGVSIVPKGYTPLDYNKDDKYLITGTVEEHYLFNFKIDPATLKKLE